MTTQHDDGGPAFPRTGYYSSLDCYDTTVQAGMTLWDHYFGAALRYCRGGDYGSCADLAHDCANIADAMIAERRKRRIGS